MLGDQLVQRIELRSAENKANTLTPVLLLQPHLSVLIVLSCMLFDLQGSPSRNKFVAGKNKLITTEKEAKIQKS